MHSLLRPWLIVTLTLIWGGSMAQTSNTPAWQAGLVIDTSAQSRQLTLGQRDQGWGLGHSDLMLRGPIGEHFKIGRAHV